MLKYATPALNSTLHINKSYTNLNFSNKIEKAITNSTLKAGVNSAIYGSSFKKDFLSELGTQTQTGLSNYIGDSYYKGDMNYFEHKLSHALSGGISSAIAGKDIASGALGALSGEIIGETVANRLTKDSIFSKGDKTVTELTSQLGSLFIAKALNKDLQSAVDSSKIAVENNTIYTYNNRVVATDGIDNKKVILLKGRDILKLKLKEAYLEGKIKKVSFDKQKQFKTIFDLSNKQDFEKLRKHTDMRYNNINKNTKIVFWNGMDNTYKQARNSQKMIAKDFTNVGLINNKTRGIVNDFFEWAPNYLTTKDVLNGYMLRQLSNGAILLTHSAGNEDAYKTYKALQLEHIKLNNINQISVASPRSLIDLRREGVKVGVNVQTQIDNPHDPVANGWINRDANYEVKYGLRDLFQAKIPIYNNLKKNHPFKNYYPEVKQEIQFRNTLKRLKRLSCNSHNII